MADIPVVREHTDAIVAVLEEQGLTVGRGEAPPGDPPYVTVYRLPGGRTTGTLGSPDRDAEIIYQVTCVSRSAEQAEWLADKALELLWRPITVPGRSVPRVSLDMHGGLMRDDQQTPPMFWVAPRFRVFSTPG